MSMPPVQPILQGEAPDPDELYANFKTVRYRYVMTYLHDEADPLTGDPHLAGEVMYTLPMTSVSYRAGMYSGTDFTGNIYLPEFYLSQMVHKPSNVFERAHHPAQMGMPIGAMFECGNRAIYVMRNEEVVWGGILWSRSYSSGSTSLALSAISFDAYVYYRAFRRSIVFNPAVNQYSVWYAVLKQTLTDFTWPGNKAAGIPNGMLENVIAEAQRVTQNTAGKITDITYTPWTGLTRGQVSNADFRNYEEVWPNNSVKIDLPPENLKLYTNPTAPPASRVEVKAQKEWRGYDMAMVGSALEEWADTKTLLSGTEDNPEGKRFEYRVVCWYDGEAEVFRQRYVFGNMSYAAQSTDDKPAPNGILSPYLGQNTQAVAKTADNVLVFDFPGQIASWSLDESNDGAATRVIVTDSGDAATKHAAYASQKDLLNLPRSNGHQGWLLYDHVDSRDVTTNIPNTLQNYADSLLRLFHVAQAAQIKDIDRVNGVGQRSSERSTNFSVTLYTTPNVPFPAFEVGDWATFAIEDPFYGGKMYLVRRIIGYTVTVVPEQESDYSHEQIDLELTDDTQIDLG
jgi:hypothetical protein